MAESVVSSFDEELKVEKEFLDSIPDDVLRYYIKENKTLTVPEVMDVIEGVYRLQFSDFKFKRGDCEDYGWLFDCINEWDFVDYIQGRLGIDYDECTKLYFRI